ALSSSLPDHSDSVGLFSAYCANPTGVRFINQEDDEQVVLFLRRHFITNIPWIGSALFLLFVPPLFFWVLNATSFTMFIFSHQFILMVVAFYYALVLNFALINFISWFYNVGLVTQKRVIDLDSTNILNHNLSETNVANIVDVSFTQRGFFQSFFNYGDVHIILENVGSQFVFNAAPKPDKVADIISDLKQLQGGSGT
ncbi:MAG: hypothetical protein ACR2LN_08050, partial [Candidatus Levyibacteriota bacterium]